MDKHLLELVKNNNRVIIPDLGAFLIRKQGDTQAISFNSIIKFDDGLFTNFISQKEKIDKKKAKEKLTEYTEKIKAELDKGNQFKVGTLGSLYKDANGKIQFLEGKAKPPAGAAAADKKTDTKEEKKEEKPEQKAPEKKEEKTDKKTEDKKTPAAESQESQGQTKRETVHEKLKAAGHKPRYIHSKGTTVSSSKTKKPAAAQKQTSSSGSGQTGSAVDNRKVLIWAGVVVLVLGLFAVYWFVLKDRIFQEPDLPLVADTLPEADEQEVAAGAATADSIEQAEEDTTAMAMAEEKPAKTEEETEPEKEAKQTVQKTQSYSGKQYYIIAGCFEIERNADNYVQTLKDKGYESARKFRKIGRLHAVCFDSYQNYQEALSALRRIQSEYESNAWMMEY